MLHPAMWTLSALLSFADPVGTTKPPPAEDSATVIAEARHTLQGAPSCTTLRTLSGKLATVVVPAGSYLSIGLASMREEVRVKLEKCPRGTGRSKKAASESEKESTESEAGPKPTKPAKPKKEREPAKEESRTSTSSMRIVDEQDRQLTEAAKTCDDRLCKQELEILGDDQLRLMLAVYAAADRADAVLPKLRERLARMLLTNANTRDLIRRVQEVVGHDEKAMAQLSEVIITLYSAGGSQLLQVLVNDPASSQALADLLRKGPVAATQLSRLLDAGVERLVTGVGVTAQDKENLRRGIELASALTDPRSRKNLIAAGQILQARSKELETLVKEIDNPAGDAAKLLGLAKRVDIAIWEQLRGNQREIETWQAAATDPRVRTRRLLSIVLQPPAVSVAPGATPTCDPFRMFGDAYLKFLHSTSRFMPRPAIPIEEGKIDREALVAKVKRTIFDPNDAVCAHQADELDRALCDSPIGVVIVSSSADRVPAIGWYILKPTGKRDFDTHEDHSISFVPHPLPASCSDEKDQIEIDAQALGMALATSTSMSVVASPVREAIGKAATTEPWVPRPARASSALLFAGLPYLSDDRTPTWTRWLTSTADVAAATTSIAAFIWSTSLRNDFARGESTSLSDANLALRVGVGAALGVAAVRAVSGGFYWYHYGRASARP